MSGGGGRGGGTLARDEVDVPAMTGPMLYFETADIEKKLGFNNVIPLGPLVSRGRSGERGEEDILGNGSRRERLHRE